MAVCKSLWPSNKEWASLGFGTYKIPSGEIQMATKIQCIGMADPTGSSDFLFSEWYEVSAPAIYLPNSHPQFSGFVYAALQSGPFRSRDTFLPDHPRIIGLCFTRPRSRTPIRAHSGDSVGYTIDPRDYTQFPPFRFPRPFEPSTPNPRPS